MAAGPTSAPKMKPGAGGIKANAKDDVPGKSTYKKGKMNPPKRGGKSGDNPRGNKPSPFAKR